VFPLCFTKETHDYFRNKGSISIGAQEQKINIPKAQNGGRQESINTG